MATAKFYLSFLHKFFFVVPSIIISGFFFCSAQSIILYTSPGGWHEYYRNKWDRNDDGRFSLVECESYPGMPARLHQFLDPDNAGLTKAQLI